MWVFGYGSLMWDDWQDEFDGKRIERARLVGYHRSFNKASTRNWGTRASPGPTLGLEADSGSECIGCAFDIPDDRADQAKRALLDREGPSFELKEVDVHLPGGDTISAIAPVNTATTYIGRVPLQERAKMVRAAQGRDGSAVEYVRNVRRHLLELGIEDPHVEALWTIMRAPE